MRQMDSDTTDPTVPSGLDDRLPAFGRYDLLLAIIPLAFLASLLASQLFGLSLEAAIVGASVVGALAVLDGLFIRPPNGLQGA